MNLPGWSDIDRAALRSFYEVGHQWSWEDLENGATPTARAARKWIESSSPPRVHPLLLPRVRGGGETQRTSWYAIAFSEAQAEELREHLSAFIGSAGTVFSGRRADLDPADIPELALAAWADGPWVYRFTVLSEKRDVVRNALQRLQQVWCLRPPLPATVFRTTEALLREFFSALVNQGEMRAVGWLGELRAGGRLSAENLVFLEIQRLAAFRRWHELAALPQVAWLTSMRRPRRITALLIEALWQTEFADFVVRGDASGALVRFRSDFYPRYKNLLRTRGSLNTAPVALTFLLAAVAVDPPRREQIPVLLEILTATPHQSFAETLAALVPADALRTPEDRIETPLQRARAAFQQGDYDAVLLHLRQAPPNPEAFLLLLECAAESQSVDDARAASDCFAKLSPQEQERALSINRRRRAWEDIQRLLTSATAATPKDWEGWLDSLDTHTDYSRLLPLAQQASVDWPLANYSNDPQRVRLLSGRLMADRDEEAQHVLRLAFPHLLGYFLADRRGSLAFLNLYRDLLLLLGVSERFTAEDWSTCQTLLLAILDAGADATVYGETVGALKEFWVRYGSSAQFDWALDILDLLVANPVLVVRSRDAFFDAVRDKLSRDYRRVRPEHWEAFRWLAADLDRTADYEALQPPETEATAPTQNQFAENLSGKMMAIYTLTEAVGARAKALLERLFPKLDVRLNHDYGGTDKLKSLAREADYFVVATRSATHAATDFLKSHRPNGKSSLIYPAGKGSSSIVSAVLSAIQRDASF